MEWSYWKVVCRYGHVKMGKEVSVARHLRMSTDATIVEVLDLVQNMPGVKKRALVNAKRITADEFSIGRVQEEEDFYLQKLKTFKLQTA